MSLIENEIYGNVACNITVLSTVKNSHVVKVQIDICINSNNLRKQHVPTHSNATTGCWFIPDVLRWG